MHGLEESKHEEEEKAIRDSYVDDYHSAHPIVDGPKARVIAAGFVPLP
jgi:hypothetical protein